MDARVLMNWREFSGMFGTEGSLGGRRGPTCTRDKRSSWTPANVCNQYCGRDIPHARFQMQGASLSLVRAGVGGEQMLGRRRGVIRSVIVPAQAERSTCGTLDCSHPYGPHTLQLHFELDRGPLKKRRPSVPCSVRVTPLDESKPDAGDHSQEHSVTGAPWQSLSEKTCHVSTVPEEVVSRNGGKAGSVSFYVSCRESFLEERMRSVASPPRKIKPLSLIWPVGPFVLVASVVLPPLYLRKVFGGVLEDSLVTDFVILFLTEMLFFLGASVFIYVAHVSRLAAAASGVEQKPASSVYLFGYRLSAKIVLGAGVLLPVATFVKVWPWTGPAAVAALAPYMIGLLVQLGFEKITHGNSSPVWPLVPVTFQMYRLHQLNRAAQLVAGLLFSLKGVEATAETMAINGSLQTLLFVLQVLGMLCLWSMGSFLTNRLPGKCGQASISSIP